MKKARLSAQPYPDPKAKDFITGEKPKETKETKLIDSNAGFFIEETEDEINAKASEPVPAPVLEPDRPECKECTGKMIFKVLTFEFHYDFRYFFQRNWQTHSC